MAEDSDTGPLEGATAETGPGAGLQTFNGQLAHFESAVACGRRSNRPRRCRCLLRW